MSRHGKNNWVGQCIVFVGCMWCKVLRTFWKMPCLLCRGHCGLQGYVTDPSGTKKTSCQLPPHWAFRSSHAASMQAHAASLLTQGFAVVVFLSLQMAPVLFLLLSSPLHSSHGSFPTTQWKTTMLLQTVPSTTHTSCFLMPHTFFPETLIYILWTHLIIVCVHYQIITSVR